MSISLEHLERLMSDNRGDLHWVQSLLEEPAGGLVLEIVKMKILDPGLMAIWASGSAARGSPWEERFPIP